MLNELVEIEKLQARINRLERLAEGRLLTAREIFAGLEAANVRLNAHAEDITDHARRLEELEKRSEELEGRRDCIIPIKTHLVSRQTMLEGRVDELAKRIEQLAERASDAYHERFRARVEREKLAERIEQLEKQVARHREDRAGDWARVAARVEKLENYAFERIGELDEAALELARYIRKLTERVEKLEEKED